MSERRVDVDIKKERTSLLTLLFVLHCHGVVVGVVGGRGNELTVLLPSTSQGEVAEAVWARRCAGKSDEDKIKKKSARC